MTSFDLLVAGHGGENQSRAILQRDPGVHGSVQRNPRVPPTSLVVLCCACVRWAGGAGRQHRVGAVPWTWEQLAAVLLEPLPVSPRGECRGRSWNPSPDPYSGCHTSCSSSASVSWGSDVATSWEIPECGV